MDEFGDDDFLADFDPDAAVLAKRQSIDNTNNSNNENIINDTPKRAKLDQAAVEATLQDYFGYPKFRPGQWTVLEAVLQGRDVAVFWATGSGKSLSYQIPPLYLGKVALVVSPLISLMQDQVHKLNGLTDKPLAVFLGSAQTDPSAERRALQGEYPIVYVTPEKLATLPLGSLRDKLCLVAIDEAHCVSEWGNDFRHEYRAVGTTVREALPETPIVTLTATATKQVQQDIVTSLRLRNPLHVLGSLDRTNLRIHVCKKRGGLEGTLRSLLQNLKDASESTIVYAPTRNQVEEVAAFLQRNSEVRVQAYHAGLTTEQRNQAHTGFLTGSIPVIVATVAFGMGIDKPDIRRIVHYAPPKTVEEYYQQIGRAGRDGLTAECWLYFAESDFDRYNSDFYLGSLTGDARKATVESMKRLRSFAMDAEKCRRRTLLEYFDQTPAFGDFCGTCDVCVNRKEYGHDLKRDFGPLGARVVLTAVAALQDQGLTNIVKVIGGNTVESYRYKRGAASPQAVRDSILKLKTDMPDQKPSTYFRELVAPLVQKGFIVESTKSANVSGYQKTWTVYNASREALQAVANPSLPIMLPVPDFIRQAEKQEEERRQRVLSDLAKKGLKKEKIPQTELDKGDGDVIRAYSKWYAYLDSARRSGKEDRLQNLEALLKAVETWRSETAVKHLMAPASVVAEHLLVSICYTAASLPPGMKLDKQSIVAAGVRTREVDGLVACLSAWVDQAQSSDSSSCTIQPKGDALMILGDTAAKHTSKWQFALYKPAKKTGKATWELSYDRFMQGESPQTIAMAPAAGKKPIQVKTVVGHILDAVVQGRNVDLGKLVLYMRPPTRSEWEELSAAELSTGMNVCGDPEKSGRNGERFAMSDFLRPIVGDQCVDTPFAERSDETKELLAKWYDLMKWYMALRRCGYEPTFSD